MAGADPQDPTAIAGPVPDYIAATRESIKGLTIGVPTAFYVDDLDSEVANILDETIAVLKREGATIVAGRTARPAPAHRGMPAGSRGRSGCLPQALADRTPRGLRPAGLDAAAERACNPRRLLSRGDALARPGAGRVQCGHGRRRCRDRAGGPGRSPHHRRKRCRQQPGRRGRDPAADALHPPDQLSGSAVAGDSRRLHPRRPSGRHAADRPFVRGSRCCCGSARRSSAPPISTTGCPNSHDQPRRSQRPQYSLHRRAHRPCRERSQLLARRRRGAWPARRVRFGQERHLARADAAVAEEADADCGQRAGARPRRAGAR